MRYAILLGPVLGLLALAACGGDGSSPTPSPALSPVVALPSPTPEPTPIPTPTPTPEPAVQRIAYIGTDLDVWIINADGSGQQKLFDIETEHGDSVSNLQWSPDGSKFTVTKRGSEDITYIVRADGETLLEVPAVGFVAWPPGGDMLVVGPRPELDVESATLILDLEGNTVMELPDGIEFSFSPDGTRLAFFEVIGPGGLFPDVRAVVADLLTAEVQPIGPDEDPSEAGPNGPPIFSPTNPSLLAYGDRLIDLDADEERLLPGRAVSWSPDGQRLLLGICERSQVYDVQRGISVLEFDISLPGIDAFCWAVIRSLSAWTPDSRRLATFDFLVAPDTLGVLHIRDIAVGDDKTVSINTVSPSEFLEFSPDSLHLVIISPEGISLVNSDDSKLTLLAEGRGAAWQPQP